MQKNDFENIDFKIKSMLENATVTPSEGVWKGIESRLDPVPAKSGRGAWLWGFGFAGAAAALALALVVSKPVQEASFNAKEAVAVVQDAPAQSVAENLSSDIQPEYTAPETRQVAVNRIPDSQPEAAAEQQESPASIGTPVTAEPVGVAGAGTVDETAGTAESVAVAEPDEVAEPVATVKPAEETAPEYGTDPFKELEIADYQQNADAKRIRVIAGGSFGESIGVSRLSKNPMRAGGFSGSQELAKGIYESGASVYGVPVSFGIGLNIPVKGILSIDTGIDYSILTRSFEGIYSDPGTNGTNMLEGDVRHHMHYLGIPVNLNLNLYSNKKINIYAIVGGEIEYCVSNIYSIRGRQAEIRFRDPVKAPQFSIKMGAGVEARLTRHLGLFIDPSARFYFQNNQPKSIRTEKQLLIGANVGLRFDL